jgi:hypothetical protein
MGAPPTPPATPTVTPKAKSTPVARPPSLSLESVWKSEASEEKTFAELLPNGAPPPADAGSPPLVLPDSAPLAVVAAAHTAAHAAAATATPLLSPMQPLAPTPPDDSVPSALSAGLASLAGDAVAPPVEPLPATRSQPLPTIIPPTADPSVNAMPVFAESWGGDAPANPFSDVSDGAIEYFVEWSLEQSIGPRALPQARFSDVPMVLPGQSGRWAAYDPASRRRLLMQFGGVFAAGLLVGALVVGLFKHGPASSSPSAPLVVAVEPVAAAAPPPPVEPAPSRAASGRDGELAITTRPPGASVSIDGSAAGTTPLTTHVAAGKHDVVVSKERYSAVTTSTEAPGHLTLDLRRPTATLHVTSTPAAADVIIAGERRGKTPVDIKLPGFESYDVRVALGGAKPWRKTIYLSHAQNRVDAALATPPRAGRR